MTHACQVTEIPVQEFPGLFYFYSHFPKKYPFFLTTTSQHSSRHQSTNIDLNTKQTASFDILFIDPGEWLKLDHNLKLSTSSHVDISPDASFLDTFDQLFLAEQKPEYKPEYKQKYQEKSAQSDSLGNFQSGKLPFTGGWFLFLAYELAQQIEPCLQLPLQEQQLPVAFAARVKSALIYDHLQEKLFFLSEPDLDHLKAYRALVSDSQAIQQANKNQTIADELIEILVEEKEQAFLDSVKVVKDYIKEGDVFQVNLSRLWQSIINHTNHDELAASLYQLLSIANPAPFSGVASFTARQGIATVISSSPERLLKIQNNQLESRPIAGTRPRSLSEREDLRLMHELHAHPKEQAEHIMLIDLIRNDLGRVCVPGTVVVNELMVNESYAHVHHIVSNVTGQLQQQTTPGEVIKAMFPGGTITGCPKVRCMEIIAELEQKSRGAYTGSMGYINLDGSMDLNILIRTMVLEQQEKEREQKLTFRAGAGLVFDSIAKKELQETRAKAKGLLRALLGSEQKESYQ
ncbi:MAG: aminodeoxychorismate synthase component I [Gammaproteobacteria bacterium]|nr:aminodeoxychorismate synthase component I [Gammaproteobacteria bacterium]